MNCYLLRAAIACLAGVVLSASVVADDLPAIPPIKRLLPPPGIEVPDEVRAELEQKLAAVEKRIANLTDAQHRADVEVFAKAVRFALRFGEFYDKADFDKARWALAQAEERLTAAEQEQTPWARQTGLVVRGFKSEIDDSVQPYGVVIPKDHDFTRPCQWYVFLHGRGDKQTDLHFLYDRAHKVGEIAPPGALVIHPFGRQCLGFKSAGETDVMEALTAAGLQYGPHGRPILVGFSMGGAGAWHLGAHYPRAFQAVSPGAGFVDVAKYQKLKPADFPPEYEQKLWGVYDVPDYTRNLFNLPVIAYSGELDKQKQAADIMAAAFQAEGRELTHLIGPKTEHRYHPEVKKELIARLEQIAEDNRGRKPAMAAESHLQTRTLRYHRAGWFSLAGMQEHWQDARLDGTQADGKFDIKTKNATDFYVILFDAPPRREFTIDGEAVEVPAATDSLDQVAVQFRREGGHWKWIPAMPGKPDLRLRKQHGLQGPIDDAFWERFLVVLPSGKAKHPRVQQWIDFEVAHLKERWAATFRGDLPVKKDTQVTQLDIVSQHLICFGDADSNSVLARALPEMPLKWDSETLKMAGKQYDPATHVPLMIYPNPLYTPKTPSRTRKYIVVNSGPTFREAHDRTNSLQNPKLPDWAVIDITTPPDAERPGKVAAADFFDEQWQVK